MPCPTTGRGRTQGVGIRASDCTFTLIRREYLLVHDCSTGLFGGAGNQRSPRGSKPRSPFHAITRLVCVLVRREQLAKSPPHLCTTRKPLSTCRAAWGGVLDSADGGQTHHRGRAKRRHDRHIALHGDAVHAPQHELNVRGEVAPGRDGRSHLLDAERAGMHHNPGALVKNVDSGGQRLTCTCQLEIHGPDPTSRFEGLSRRMLYPNRRPRTRARGLLGESSKAPNACRNSA